jgi:hypothetical protein
MADHWVTLARAERDGRGRVAPGQLISDDAHQPQWGARLRAARNAWARREAKRVMRARLAAGAALATAATGWRSVPRTPVGRARERRFTPSRRSSRAGPPGDDDSGPPPARPRCSYCGTALGEICWSEQLREWCCQRCYGRQAPAIGLGPPLALDGHGKRRRATDNGRAPRRALARAYALAAAAGLRPVVDPALELVRCDCPGCHAGEGDRLGIWRPMAIVPRRGTLTIRCDECGREEVRHAR